MPPTAPTTPTAPTAPAAPAALSAVILAGGRATRMGGADKGLIEFLGEPLAARICAGMESQATELMINANRNLDRYRQLGCKVVEDQLPGHQGPLAGMHAALAAAKYPWLLTIPCDGPFVHPGYARIMHTAAREQNVRLAVAHDGTRMQPVYSLIHRDLAPSLEQFLATGERKIDRWHAQHPFATVDFSAEPSMFININTPQQLAEMEQQTLAAG